MLIGGRLRRTIEPLASGAVSVLDQRLLPHRVAELTLDSADAAAQAIATMAVRGAPLIGVTAAYGLALQARHDAGDSALRAAAERLRATRPTAVNLAWAVQRALDHGLALPVQIRAEALWRFAAQLADDDVAANQAIGRHGLPLLRQLAERKRGAPLQLLTHCNAGWLATVDWGTALAPVYAAQAAGLPLHVWVDETRPRNQGASLTAFELREQGVPHTVIADNAGGHLMQRGEVDAVLVGCDRVAANGDVANKIGTYPKALAARDCGVPFWVAMPLSTLDRTLADGQGIPIEQRGARELTHVAGRAANGELLEVQLVPDGSAAANPAFDVTPARLVDALITERGVVRATAEAVGALSRVGPHPDPLPRVGEEGRRADGALRAAIVGAVRRLDALGLNRGSTGNASARGVERAAGCWITPTGMGSDVAADDLVWLGDDGRSDGRWQPSSEAAFHRAIYRARPDLRALLHMHSPAATALAGLRRGLPAFHYMVAIAGGDDVPCVPYSLFGGEQLAQAVAAAFAGRDACLLANHGLVAGGASLEQALKVAIEVEALCDSYLRALAAGEPALLTREQMAEVRERFGRYGVAERSE